MAITDPVGDRDGWYDALADDICTLGRDLTRHVLPRLPFSFRPPLAVATVVLSVCCDDYQAQPSYSSANRILQAGLAEGTVEDIASSLVAPLRVSWRRNGVPAADWWDAGALQAAVLKYLSPRMAIALGITTTRSFLASSLGLGPSVINSLLDRPAETPPLPPSVSQLLADAPDDPAASLLFGICAQPKLQAELERARSQTLLTVGPVLPPLWASRHSPEREDWLRTAWTTINCWRALADQVDSALRRTDERDRIPFLEKAFALASSSGEACKDWLASLGLPELALLANRDDTDLRRRRFLDAHLRTYNVSLLVPDAVPDQVDPRDPAPVPNWVHTDVFTQGGRLMHVAAGAQVLWWAVAETEADQDLFGAVPLGSHRPPRGLEIEGPSDGGRFALNLAPGGLGTHTNDLRLPFSYFPGNLKSAIETILLSLIGVRIDYYRLVGERALFHLGGERIEFPEGVPGPMMSLADQALAIAEAANPGTDAMWILAQWDEDEQGRLMFVIVDNAKSESLLTEMHLAADDSAHGKQVRAARQHLAEAELTRVSATIDAHDSNIVANLATAVTAARDAYRELLQRSERTAGSELAIRVEGTVVPGRAFVQFAELEDYLAAVVVIDDGTGPTAITVDLNNVTVNNLRMVSDAWLGLLASEDALSGVALGDVLAWLGAVVHPVIVALDGLGVNHLIVCPSRALEPFPLHAVPVGDGVLQDIVDVTYAPSAAVMYDLVHRPRLGGDERVLVAAFTGANVPATVGLEVLSGPRLEAEALQSLLSAADVLVDDVSDATAVLGLILDHDVVHLAGHARSDRDELSSGLWIGGRSSAAALLSAASILAGPLLDRVSLVVLNACGTALHPVGGVAVQAWRGLDTAFLARGVRAVLSSLWPIGDVFALVWAVTFHAERVAGSSVARAATIASNALRYNDVPGHARAHLDRLMPSWQTELTLGHSGDPFAWAAWRASGMCW